VAGVLVSSLLALAAVLAVPAAIWWTATHGPLASVSLEDGGSVVVVRPLGWSVLWSLHRSVHFPVSSVRSVRLGVARRSAPRGFRSPGTALPGVMVAGTLRRIGWRSFWLVGRASTVTVVELDRASGAGVRFDALVLELPPADAARLAGLIR